MSIESSLIIGASGGIGRALSHALAARGPVTRLSRSEDGFDITDEGSVAHHFGGLSGDFDRIVVASGGLSIDGAAPEKSISVISSDAMAAQFRLNAIGPALVLKHVTRLLPRDRRAVMAVLSARVGSIGDNHLGGWISYRAAKAAANQVVRTASIELKRRRPKSICVALHPGTVKTPLTAAYLSRHKSVEPDEAAANLIRVMDGLTIKDSGQFFDWAGKPVPW